MRLIDADALEERIVAEAEECPVDIRDQYEVGYHNGMEMAKAMLIAAPTIDAQPVVHGEWEYIDFVSPNCQCTVCGGLASFDGDYHSEKTPYCPNCGATMDM